MTDQALPKRYQPAQTEPRLQAWWQEAGIYLFSPDGTVPVFSIDTPPATVSGELHLGHVFSYSHTDLIARFCRMNGYNVFYPMGYDDNGLPTERLVEKREGVRPAEVGRRAFIERCLAVSVQAEAEYEALWKRLGLSVDWRYSYRTIDTASQRTSQLSFIDLYRKGLVYRREAPTIWCPECGTAIAQAELNDMERASTLFTLTFDLEDGEVLKIATTRPELLPACVAVFTHPGDGRFRRLVGERARVPLFGHQVPILADPAADPDKGTGAVMCCTFGDSADVAWWYKHKLPLRVAIDRSGHTTDLSGPFAGLPVEEARAQMVKALEAQDRVTGRQVIAQTVRVHERCDTPVEYVDTMQWFIRVLDFKEQLLAAGSHVNWHPEHMQARYREWVENLEWDWCISRQRYYGVAFPVWYCEACGEVMLAEASELPVIPTERGPAMPCGCGSTAFKPEKDVMDTWATSSMSPQIVGHWLEDPALYANVFPFALRPQAHEIIRTWAFYTIVKSQYHLNAVPWSHVAISGWGLAPEGAGKISKSRGGGVTPPMEMIARYSADAVRYWAASTGPGKDTIISEEKIQLGAKLVTKLWNVARFSQRFLNTYRPAPLGDLPGYLSPADRWILACTQRLIRRVTTLFEGYDYASAKSETEAFFWRDLADNYLEMAKVRLYGTSAAEKAGAQYTLYEVLLTTLKLFAPLMPFVTEEIYQKIFAESDGSISIHVSRWPAPDPRLEDGTAVALGETLVAIATAVRRFKSEHSLALGTEIARLQLAPQGDLPTRSLQEAGPDLASITRARQIEVVPALDSTLTTILEEGAVRVALRLR